MNEDRLIPMAQQAGIIAQSENDLALPVREFAESIVIDCVSMMYNNMHDEETAQDIGRMIFTAYGIYEAK